MEAKGIIRKISIGDLKTGITYVVGGTMKNGALEIVQILHDIDMLINYGINKYDVFIRDSDSGNTRLWKSFMEVPTSVEYDISVEHEIL